MTENKSSCCWWESGSRLLRGLEKISAPWTAVLEMLLAKQRFAHLGGEETMDTYKFSHHCHLTVFDYSLGNRIFSLPPRTPSQRGVTFCDLVWRSRRTCFWLIKLALQERGLGGNLYFCLSVGLSVTFKATCQTCFHQSSQQAVPYGHIRHVSWPHSDTQCAKRSTNHFAKAIAEGKTSNQTTCCTPINTFSADFMPTTSCPALLSHCFCPPLVSLCLHSLTSTTSFLNVPVWHWPRDDWRTRPACLLGQGGLSPSEKILDGKNIIMESGCHQHLCGQRQHTKLRGAESTVKDFRETISLTFFREDFIEIWFV